ncbi:Macrophage migration inhibitory factor [Trema orientale]|uniref:L-dopachrome isomerase n=1 Tax=Trema orientale TaxID=63057 RepID=A0A2P5F4A8_TREOI|nr:Macrophage migration inhibitory factor [Trema orientale]
MPTLNLFTNMPVDAVVASDILKDATKAVAKIIGKPESGTNTCELLRGGKSLVSFSSSIIITSSNGYWMYVMILINGGVPIAFGGTEEPAAYGELISIGGLGPSVNGKLSSTIAEILQTKLSIDSSRFYIKFYDVARPFFGFNGSTF